MPVVPIKFQLWLLQNFLTSNFCIWNPVKISLVQVFPVIKHTQQIAVEMLLRRVRQRFRTDALRRLILILLTLQVPGNILSNFQKQPGWKFSQKEQVVPVSCTRALSLGHEGPMARGLQLPFWASGTQWGRRPLSGRGRHRVTWPFLCTALYIHVQGLVLSLPLHGISAGSQSPPALCVLCSIISVPKQPVQ